MKKAVILTGAKQYLVEEGDVVDVEKLKTSDKQIKLDALLVIEDSKVSIGKPTLEGRTITADIVEPEIKSEKVTAIRYKAKKRVHKTKGHRQLKTRIKIAKIS